MKLVRVRVWRWEWVRDPHPFPHFMRDGGCYCTCSLCVAFWPDGSDSLRCICGRCNEGCTSFGRLGSVVGVMAERRDGYPEDAPAASRWERRRRW